MRYLKIESEMRRTLAPRVIPPREGRVAERRRMPSEAGRGGACDDGELSDSETSPHPGSLTLAFPPLAGRDSTEQAAKAAIQIKLLDPLQHAHVVRHCRATHVENAGKLRVAHLDVAGRAGQLHRAERVHRDA